MMRELNKEEREIVKSVVQARKDKSIKGFCLAKIFNDSLDCVAIEWTEDKVIIYSESSINAHEQFMRLCDMIALFQYLENEGMLLLYRNPNLLEEKALYNRKLFEKKGSVYVSKTDVHFVLEGKTYVLYGMNKQQTFEIVSDITTLIDKYVCALTHPTQELIDYVDNGFKTKDDMQYNCTRNISIAGIVIAIVVGIASIIVNICRC